MDITPFCRRFFLGSLLILLAMVSLGSTGCAVYSNGMTLPNPHYLKNQVQYYPRGNEFPFASEAAHLQESQQSMR